jgi:hypothetical protein
LLSGNCECLSGIGLHNARAIDRHERAQVWRDCRWAISIAVRKPCAVCTIGK